MQHRRCSFCLCVSTITHTKIRQKPPKDHSRSPFGRCKSAHTSFNCRVDDVLLRIGHGRTREETQHGIRTPEYFDKGILVLIISLHPFDTIICRLRDRLVCVKTRPIY